MFPFSSGEWIALQQDWRLHITSSMLTLERMSQQRSVTQRKRKKGSDLVCDVGNVENQI
ncbi:hypothetical protein Hanom_Chr15g01343951 [Helianthus anomalus]